MKQVDNKYKCLPFWSWNDELDEEELVEQVEWMHENGVGGFFMHARGGLKTEYLSEKWFSCIEASGKRAKELCMEAYAYDENGWPSGFVGGKLLDEIENHDRYLTFTQGEYDKDALVSYDLSGDALKRVTDGKNCLNVFMHYSTSTADVLNDEVVDKFLALTHEEYQKRDNYSLKGFFTDEPQYYRAGTPYTKMVQKYFAEVYGEDILDGLGLLFVEKQGYRAFRYKFWKAMQALMLENFAKKVYEWCDERGYKLTGHYVEENKLATQMWCCGGVMPFYEYEHIPGIDKLGRPIANELAPKQVGSVAAQLGKKQVITETFGCAGWDISPLELKTIAENQYVHGVNLMCQHLLPFSEVGQRKRDYPSHFSVVNPWVRKGFKDFNDYFSVLGETLANSTELVEVGVLHPIRSAYFDYKRYTKPDGEVNHFGIEDLETLFAEFVEMLGENHIGHHYLDETLLEKYGSVDGDKLVMGKCAYKYVVLPKIYTMDKSTERLLKTFVDQGGKILVAFDKPEYLEGEEHDYSWLNSNVTLEDIKKAQPYSVQGGHGKIRSTFRQDENGRKFIYIINTADATDVKIVMDKNSAFESYDILTDKFNVVSSDVHFEKGQSYLLYLTDKQPTPVVAKKEVRLGKSFTVSEKVDNYLTLDFARISFDGKTYGEKLHHMGIFNDLLERRYRGDLFVKYEFTVEELPNKCLLLAEKSDSDNVTVNGKVIEKCGVSAVEKRLYVYDIKDSLKLGNNEIVIKMHYFQSEKVYYALFGENVTESFKNCLAYDTDIEAVYLKGDFGVCGDFEQGNAENILLGDNFKIAGQKNSVNTLIKDGYPFFSGDIMLKQTLNLDDVNSELVIDERFHFVEVKLNGIDLGRKMFTNRIDLSGGAKVGENQLELTLTVGNRNLLGPFHTPMQENPFVGPATFERLGTWTNGKSNNFRDSYSFVKTIL